MIRNLKALGLALVAMLAMGAMAVASASAQAGHISVAAPPATLTGTDVKETAGEPTPSLTANEEKVHCTSTKVTYTATLEAASNAELTVAPKYEDCAIGTAPATVTMNGCDYKFYDLTTVTSPHKWSILADLQCPVEKQVEIHKYSSAHNHTTGVTTCTMTLRDEAANDGLGGTTVTEETDAKDSLRLEGTVEPTAQTHGACSFGFTLNIKTKLHISATVSANEAIDLTD